MVTASNFFRTIYFNVQIKRKDKTIIREANDLKKQLSLMKTNHPEKFASQIKEYCQKILRNQGRPEWITLVVALTGNFQYGLLPNEFLINRIIPWLNPPGMTWWVVDKGNLELIFNDDAIPVLCTHDADRTIRTRDNQLINSNDEKLCTDFFTTMLMNYPELCVKLLGFSKGEGIYFTSNIKMLREFILKGQRFAIQPAIKQHQTLNTFNNSSLNTIRIISLNWEGEIHILSAYLRIGRSGQRIDTGNHGIAVSINIEKGCLSEKGFDNKYLPHTEHPDSHKKFIDVEIPSWQKAKDMVVRAHSKIFVSRFLGWDIAILEDGTPKITEVNSHPNILRAQFFNGPIFKNFTDDILNKWFEK